MRPNAPLWVTAALLLAGCADPDSPQTEVRRMIERLELAAEARDVGDVMTHVSSQYRDARGHDRDEIARYIRGYFIAHQAIHLLTRIERLEFPSSDEARLAVLVATVGRQADAADAWELASDLQRFDLVLVRDDGSWKINWASWRRPLDGQ
ncbi:MAG: hypothetical protein RBS02_03850 [Steroidobacteraceae bacterium]|jgi:hypothetical protein|nr:hypothetical protein [Steroidobacteraceae bacterium]